MKILIINEGYSDNLGDQAINDSLQYLVKSHSDAEILFQDFTSDKLKEINVTVDVKQKSSFFKRIIRCVTPVTLRWPIIQSLRIIKTSRQKYDLVVIGGGQLILSNEVFAIAMFCWVFFLRLFGNKNIVLFGVGSGTTFSTSDKLLFSYALKRVSKVYVRDYKSIEILKNNFNIQASFVYDVAFMHNKIQNVTTKSKYNILLGIISFDVYKIYNNIKITQDDFFKSWVNLLTEHNIELSSVKLFYTTQEDRSASIEFKEYVTRNYQLNLKLIETNTKEILINELSKSEIVVSGRMHALILGLTYGCEIISYPISNKLKEFNTMFSNDFDLKIVQNEIEKYTREILKR